MTLLEKIKTDYEEHLKQNWTPNGRKRIGNLVDVAPTKYQTFHIE